MCKSLIIKNIPKLIHKERFKYLFPIRKILRVVKKRLKIEIAKYIPEELKQ